MRKMIWLRFAVVGIIIAAGGAFFLHGDKNITKGRDLFSYYCSPCHGWKGKGDGFNAKNLDPQPRDLSDGKERYMEKLDNMHLFKVISGGGKAIDKSHIMPSYGDTLSEKEMWSLVAFIRTLHSYKGERVDFNKEMKIERPKFSIKKIDMTVKKEDKALAQTMDSES